MFKRTSYLGLCCLLSYSISSHAFDFQTLAENFPVNTGRTFCFAAEDIDSLLPTGCKITNGAEIGTDASGLQFNFPDGTAAVFPDSPTAPSVVLELVDQQTFDINVDGADIGLTPGQTFMTGTITDYVWRDTRDNNLVFGLRIILNPQVSGAANVLELNNYFRSGFEGSSAAIGWARGSNSDNRLFAGVRSSDELFSSAPLTFDPDVVRLTSDINVSEGNPRSGYFMVKTNAPFYTTGTNGLSVFQAGEEGQPLSTIFFDGFVPTTTDPNSTTPVPMPLWSLVVFMFTLLGLSRLKLKQ